MHTISVAASSFVNGPGNVSVSADLGTYSLSIHATPYNFTKDPGYGVAESDGTLVFSYHWKPTTGSFSDLDSCYEHEFVTYPTTNLVFDGINFYVPIASFNQPNGYPNPTTEPGLGTTGWGAGALYQLTISFEEAEGESMFLKHLSTTAIGLLLTLRVLSTASATGSHDARLGIELDPISISVSRLTESNFVAGHPIILHYEMLYNGHGDTIATPLFPRTDLWYSLELDGPDRQVTRWDPSEKPRRSGPFALPTTIFTEGSTRSGDIVVPHDLSITKGGDYTLKVHISMQYVDLGKAVPPSDLMQLVSKSHKFISKDVVIPLKVSDRDPSALRRFANFLYFKITNAPDRAQQDFYIEELFSMADQDAAETWRTVAIDPLIKDRFRISRALAETQSTKAADILITMEYEMPIKVGRGTITTSVLPLLRQMEDEGTPEMKTHIREALAQHGYTRELPYNGS